MTTEERLNLIGKEMERKLIELMGEEAYVEWSKQTARGLFLLEVQGMEDSEFKDFILDHFLEITE